jgi:nitrogen fixation protein FixH
MSARPFEVRGWHVLAGVLAFFAAVIGVNVAFTVAAVSTFPGEDVRRSYLQGLQYNDTLAERRAQTARGWRAAAGLSGEGDSAVVEVTLRDRAGAPIEGAVLAGALQRPTDARFDRALAFEPLGGGRYAARVDALETGRWRLRARASRGDALDFEAELTWPP